MAITSSESSLNMSNWVAEKADCVLEEACRIVDLLKRNEVNFDKWDEEEFYQALYAIIFDAAKLSSFGHENMPCWSNEWVNLMFHQGHDRFLEFQKRARKEVPNETPPQKYVLSVQELLDLFDAIESMLSIEDKSLVRHQILEYGRKLAGMKLGRQVGNKLLQLIDDQAVHGRLSWDEFTWRVGELVSNEREKLIREKADPKS